MKVKKIFAFAFLLIPFFSFCQNKYTVSGYVKDSLSGETLIGATISVLGESKGITSNQFGFYSITLTAGTYNFICSYVGYIPQIKTIRFKLPMLNIILKLLQKLPLNRL